MLKVLKNKHFNAIILIMLIKAEEEKGVFLWSLMVIIMADL